MKNDIYTFLFIFSLSLFVLTSCIQGNVINASLDDGIGEAEVSAYAQCEGSGCTDYVRGDSVFTDTSSGGSYYFPSHKKYFNMLLSPHSDEEAVEIVIKKPGFSDLTIWHQMDFSLFDKVQTAYLCADSEVDSDGDGLCDSAESTLGTNPYSSDTDGDNLSDYAEIYGFNGLDLKAYGADPFRKDIFLEIDYYAGLRPNDTAMQMVIDAFNDAPVSNPNGIDGINLHIVIDDEIDPADADSDLNPAWTDFDAIKNIYFENRREKIFHYCLFVNQYNGGSSSGLSRGIPGRDLIVSLGNWLTPGGTIQQQAGTLMHELGHNLGLRHGGYVNTNYKPNYLSIMSYNYQLIGLTVDGMPGVLDYSRLQVAAVDESSFNESLAFAPSLWSSTTENDLNRYRVRIRLDDGSRTWLRGTASVNLDADRDGTVETAAQAIDLDGDGNTTDIHSSAWNDWVNIIFDGGGAIGDDYLGDTSMPDSGLRQRNIIIEHEDDVEPCLSEHEAML